MNVLDNINKIFIVLDFLSVLISKILINIFLKK